MTLHIFNPEHDIALACNLANFTAPHAGRCLRSCLGYLPALWAEDGDAVLVDNADFAEKAYAKALMRINKRVDGYNAKRVEFVDNLNRLEQLPVDSSLFTFHSSLKISPWGWDAALRNQLIRFGVNGSLLPTLDEIDEIRMLSHRRVAAEVLKEIRIEGTVGEAVICRTVEEIAQSIGKLGKVVLKAPWSSSGRGIRFVEGSINDHQMGWIRNTLAAQDCLMLEPYYNKVKDFGMEFFAHPDGSVTYEGLSLFSTANGAYIGNILATECAKEEIITRYIPVELLSDIKQMIVNVMKERLKGKYTGPFGVDMMVVATDDASSFLLHPCVEINLRRTMGHVALCISPADDDIKRVMRIDYNLNNYQLIIQNL